ncbi:MAG: lipoyl synthase [Candidatus Omnitrophota bacterium]
MYLTELNRPEWLKVRLNINDKFRQIRELNRRLSLNTVCQEAACPNVATCWSNLEITYILLGKICTRSCKFCNIIKDKPKALNPLEPQVIAQAVEELKIGFVVLTSVARDDLADFGLGQFLDTICLIKNKSPQTKVEILIPDFGTNPELLKRISHSGADVIGHNIETIASLYPLVRPQANFGNSLNVLKILKLNNSALITKTAILLGLGETEAELTKTIRRVKENDVDILYLGQYLKPSKNHWPVKKFYSLEEFAYYKQIAQSLGFKVVVSEPLARSSWKARETYELATLKNCHI